MEKHVKCVKITRGTGVRASYNFPDTMESSEHQQQPTSPTSQTLKPIEDRGRRAPQIVN